MKNILILATIFLLFTASCGNSKSDEGVIQTSQTLDSMPIVETTITSKKLDGIDQADQSSTIEQTATAAGQEASKTSQDDQTPTIENSIADDSRSIIDTKKGGDPYERYMAYTEALTVATGEPFINLDYGPLRELIIEGSPIEESHQNLEIEKAKNIVVGLPEKSQSKHILSYSNPGTIYGKNGEKTTFEENDMAVKPVFDFFDCHIDDSFTKDLDDGTLVDPGVRTKKTLVRMRRDSGEWKVYSIVVKSEYDQIVEDCFA